MEAEVLLRKGTLHSGTIHLMDNHPMLDTRLNHLHLCNIPSLCKVSSIRRTPSLLQLHRPVHRRRHPSTILMPRMLLHSADNLSIPNTSPRKWEPHSTTRLLIPTPRHETRILLPSKHITKARRSCPSPTTPLPSIRKTRHRASHTSILEVIRHRPSMRRPRQDLLREAIRHSKVTPSHQAVHRYRVHTATCLVNNNHQHRAMRRPACHPHRASARGLSNTKLISRNSKQDMLVGILANSTGSLIVPSRARSRRRWTGAY